LIVAQYESTTSSFFFDVAPTTYICSLSLHDALPISFGSGAMAWGVYSNASGYGSVADGDSSTAVGGWLYYEDPVTGEVLLDATTTAGEVGASAFGAGAQAIGAFSLASGAGAVANGLQSTSVGYSSQVDSDYATAMGAFSSVTGTYGTAIGYGSDASGDYGLAVGGIADYGDLLIGFPGLIL